MTDEKKELTTDEQEKDSTTETKIEPKCVWSMGSPCSDEVEEISFFDKQITVPVCSNHIDEHRIVMLLHKNNYDVEEILQQTSEWRKAEALVLKLSGLDAGDVDL